MGVPTKEHILGEAKIILSMVEQAIADIDAGQKYYEHTPLGIGQKTDTTEAMRAKLVIERDRGRAMIYALETVNVPETQARVDEIMAEHPMPEVLQGSTSATLKPFPKN
jgi:hypothetical protein